MKNNRLDGEKLRQILKSRGLAISDIARLCGKNLAVMSQWISGKRNPRRGEIQKIADALRLNISEISDYSDDDFTAIPLSSEEPIPEYRYIYETVMSQLQKRVSESGQVKTAEFIGVSGGYISMLLNNKANISDLKLSAFLKLFPNIKIDFGLQPASPDLREYLHSLIDLIDQPQMLSLKPILELMAGKTTIDGINQKQPQKEE